MCTRGRDRGALASQGSPGSEGVPSARNSLWRWADCSPCSSAYTFLHFLKLRSSRSLKEARRTTESNPSFPYLVFLFSTFVSLPSLSASSLLMTTFCHSLLCYFCPLCKISPPPLYSSRFQTLFSHIPPSVRLFSHSTLLTSFLFPSTITPTFPPSSSLPFPGLRGSISPQVKVLSRALSPALPYSPVPKEPHSQKRKNPKSFPLCFPPAPSPQRFLTAFPFPLLLHRSLSPEPFGSF